MIKIGLFFIGLLLLVSCASNTSSDLNIATSANVLYPMNEIVDAFEVSSQLKCNIISSSSGKLTAQIKEGAAYDVLISADVRYPQFLFDAGLTEQKPISYATGRLVLWSMNKDVKVSPDILMDEQIKHIAIANPMTAPYGRAAKQALEHLGLYDAIESKLVFGESISQVNQFINSGAADIGVTSLSVVRSPQLNEHKNWLLLDSTFHEPIIQGMVSLKNGKASPELKSQFMDFIVSNASRKIFKKYGYALK